MEKEFSGIIPSILSNNSNVVEYNPSRNITLDEIGEWFDALSRIKPRKPEYILSKWEAENLPLWQLTWLGENYIVLCSLEVSNIVKKRESDPNTTTG